MSACTLAHLSACTGVAADDSKVGADSAGPVDTEVPQGLVEMANMLTEVYSTGVTEFLQGADVESDSESGGEEEEWDNDDDDRGGDRLAGDPADVNKSVVHDHDDDDDGNDNDNDDDDDDDDDCEAWVDAEIGEAAAAGGQGGASASFADNASSATAVAGTSESLLDEKAHDFVSLQGNLGAAGHPSTDSIVDAPVPHAVVGDAAAGTAAILSVLVRKDEVGIGVEPLFQLSKGWLKFSKEVTG